MPEVAGGDVAAVIRFNLQDNPGWPSGLRRDDGSPEPALATFTGLVAERAGVGLPR